MSSIEKLSIRGIRSFSPNREEIIEFFHPLTVILGDNGSGKTTIIECLKISCTGALPPGTRSGHSFIHDPRIAGTNEVKASVRLRLRNRAGKPMVVQRTFQLVQTKSKTQYKALDGVVRVVNELGEKVSMSHKCAELDRHIPEMLGVSKAILESVIFCHQEDSNWPLQEGAVLKKRFDDIFESARYTKALEAIRKLRKARNDDAKEFKRELDVLNVKLKMAEEIREKIEVAEEKLSRMKDKAAQLDDSVDNAENTLREMKQLSDEIVEERAKLGRLQSDASQKEADIRRAYDNIEKMMSDSDNELVVLYENYDSIISGHQQEYQDLQNQESQWKTERVKASNMYSELCAQKGNVESKIEAQQVRMTELLSLGGELGVKYKIQAHPISSQEGDIKSFVSKFQVLVSEKEKNLDVLSAENQKRGDVLAAALSEVEQRLHYANKQIESKTADIRDLGSERHRIAERIKNLSSHAVPSPPDISEAERKVAEAEESLKNHKEQTDILALNGEIQGINKQIHDANFEITDLAEKIEVLRTHDSDYASLEAKRVELRTKEEEFHAQFEEKLAEFKSLFEGDLLVRESSIAEIVSRITDVIASRKRLCEEMKENLAKAGTKLQENLASSNLMEKNLADAHARKNELERNQVGELKKMIAELLPGEDLRSAEAALQNAEKMYLEAKDKTARSKNTVAFLKVFLEKGKSEKCCPLCTRSMTTEEEEAFIEAINRKTADRRVEEKIKKAVVLEEAAFKTWKAVEGCMPSWREWSKIEDQIPRMTNELDGLYTLKRSLQSEVNDKESRREHTLKQQREAEEGHREFLHLDKKAQDIRGLQIRITEGEERLQSTVSVTLGANAPNLAQALAWKDQKQTAVHELNMQLQRKQAQLQSFQTVLQSRQSDLHNKQQDLHRMKQLRGDFEVANAEQSKLQEREKTLRDELAKISTSKPELEADVHGKTAEIQAHRKKSSEQQRVIRQEFQQIAGDFRAFSDKFKVVEAETTQQLDQELRRLAEQIAQVKQKEVTATRALEEISPEIISAHQRLVDQESMKRQIRDNLDYRRLKSELGAIQSEIESTRLKINALPSLDDVDKRVRAAEDAVVAARDDRSTLGGRQQQLEYQIRDEKIKLKSADYRNVEEKHRQKLIQFETTTMAVADLDKYFKALDQSLLQYHSKKVEEINSIIRSLWQITYKGQDIDTIELVSGQEVNTGGTKASRSYDYRVVMKKGGALVDMRGRCSAGQKVLAALVIRLALAETFCLNCGILALDEPTTNLDTENKYGLAQAITDILNARAGQQNFQLVCITHDEEFVQMLSQAQAMDGSRPEYYWRISREDMGNNRFCSKIEKKEWREGI
ncbi:hypothetical protein Poli38472_000318 [Pythium oligandrum]|uniref:Rad50/SbcC-type AAA domain-containing protein n=1 Tax=Pythium oligandrum TaxID=41045 RepID=A0A8K1CBI4_PYTOL|nr:hypothetical protein Poli38472_000318 [Pythium oligandrum]|eukprot:TMW60276.1 hypothetical protein Poli38472_000318 [Pythium oligandrum]